MSLDGNCGKFGQINLIFCMMLPVGVVLCMLGKYRVFPPLAVIIAARRRCMLTARCYMRSAGISAHLSSRAWRNSPRFWGGMSILVIARPNSSQICSMQAAWSWWRCPDERNQGLPEHGEVWCYRLGSGSYPWNEAWQMALRYFTNAPVELTSELSVGEHKRRFGTTVKSSPDVYRTPSSLDPISLVPLLEALHRVKLESGHVTEDDMLPMGHCQVLPTLCPLQGETAVVGSQ